MTFVLISTFINNKLHDFSYTGEESSDTIFGATSGNSLIIENFTGNSIININTGITIPLGVEFVSGIAASEIQPKYSGDVIYVEDEFHFGNSVFIRCPVTECDFKLLRKVPN